MKLYLDDLREPKTEGWLIARTAEVAEKLLRTGLVSEISFDHDLGTPRTGYDVACTVEELVVTGKIKCPLWNVHSANPVGRDKIEVAMSMAEKYEA